MRAALGSKWTAMGEQGASSLHVVGLSVRVAGTRPGRSSERECSAEVPSRAAHRPPRSSADSLGLLRAPTSAAAPPLVTQSREGPTPRGAPSRPTPRFAGNAPGDRDGPHTE